MISIDPPARPEDLLADYTRRDEVQLAGHRTVFRDIGVAMGGLGTHRTAGVQSNAHLAYRGSRDEFRGGRVRGHRLLDPVIPTDHQPTADDRVAALEKRVEDLSNQLAGVNQTVDRLYSILVNRGRTTRSLMKGPRA